MNFYKEDDVTDRQQIQRIVADYFARKTSAEVVAEVEDNCMICTEHGSKLCELHAADERTEIERQTIQTRWNRQAPRI